MVLISSRRVSASEDDMKEFDTALQALCKDLAVDVVRNGVREMISNQGCHLLTAEPRANISHNVSPYVC